MGLFNRKKPSNKRSPATATRMDGYREDFMDYESQFTGQPQRFGDTRPVYTPLMADQDYELIDNIIHKNGIAHKIVFRMLLAMGGELFILAILKSKSSIKRNLIH